MGVHGEATVTSGALAGVRVLLDEQAGGQGAARGAGGSVRAKVLSGEFAGSMRFLRFDKLRLDGDDEEAAARPATSSRALLKGEDAREGDQRPTAERVPAAQQDLPCVGGGSATAQRSKADKAVAAAIEAARAKQEARDAALREAERKAAAEEVEMQRKREENKRNPLTAPELTDEERKEMDADYERFKKDKNYITKASREYYRQQEAVARAYADARNEERLVLQAIRAGEAAHQAGAPKPFQRSKVDTEGVPRAECTKRASKARHELDRMTICAGYWAPRLEESRRWASIPRVGGKVDLSLFCARCGSAADEHRVPDEA